MMTRILQDENDIMILDTKSSARVDLSLFALLIGFGSFGVFLERFFDNSSAYPAVLDLLFGILIFSVGLYSLLDDAEKIGRLTDKEIKK